ATCADAAGPDRGQPFAVDEGSQPVGNQAFADTVGAREEERTRTCAVAPAGLEALEDILVADQFERRAHVGLVMAAYSSSQCQTGRQDLGVTAAANVRLHRRDVELDPMEVHA